MRPVPEMGICFVFTPAQPKLYTLNASAWLVLALCDGRRGRRLVDAYAGKMPPDVTRAAALGEVRDAIADLERKGIVERLAVRR
ncbi:MAG: PqqD family protein [Betaproteobacteria bacterium]